MERLEVSSAVGKLVMLGRHNQANDYSRLFFVIWAARLDAEKRREKKIFFRVKYIFLCLDKRFSPKKDGKQLFSLKKLIFNKNLHLELSIYEMLYK